ncbi:hypothetical protein RMSM_02996 [Rhodopirellula maiorica SM1]|uniref:Uncharacterized protein n=1 Tax=Rhodopirellula maiorica SM1 TaxID=1265738 RepID=M5RXE7_9BACT|nr:hypothetical protein RMSM_02996 [Rhodopirellula maiorica SM1]
MSANRMACHPRDKTKQQKAAALYGVGRFFFCVSEQNMGTEQNAD